ncbi:MAG: tetratricopeptide repeat protein, partial [Myxococcota bacterium]|nr:tetratricopeptide repeat protein [Myxococcota bacterium]
MRRLLASAALCGLALIASLAPTPVAAQDEERPSIEVARSRMEQGQAYYLQGRFGEAAAEFEAAYQAEPFSAFLYNAAVAYENAGQPSRALDFFQLYLERDPAAADRAAVEQRIAGLRAALEAHRVATEA